MKVVLFFALLGLSFSWAREEPAHCKPSGGGSGSGGSGSGGSGSGGSGSGGSGSGGSSGKTCQISAAPNPTATDCLTGALVNSLQFLEAAKKFACTYKACLHDKIIDYKEYQAAAREFTDLLRCLGCKTDGILGQGKTFEDVLVEISLTTKGVGASILQIVKVLKLDTLVADVYCTLSGALVKSDCLKNALTKASQDTQKDLKRCYCKATKGSTVEAAKGLASVLSKTGCVLDETLKTQKALETALASLGKDVVPLVKGVLDVTKTLLETVLCTATGLLVGDDGILGGILTGLTGSSGLFGG